VQDIGLFDTGGTCLDLVIENGDLKADDTLETAVLISLFSDHYLAPDELPQEETDPRGWWADNISDPADDEIGSLLWLLERGKTDNETLNTMQDSAIDSLQWLIDEGIAETVNVVVSRPEINKVLFEIEIIKPQGDNIPFKFIWDNQELRRLAA
jgi:phage gp46-like protein